jgi:hypothetical protein
MKLRLTQLLVVTAVMTFAIGGEATRLADGDLTLTQRQIAGSLRPMLRNDPVFRASYIVHQRFMDLYNRMPVFEQASFGPTVRTVSWRSVKWNVEWIYDSPDGIQYVGLGYGPGPGLDYFQTSRLVNGHYVGREHVDVAAASRDKAHFAWTNTLPIDCRDVRNGKSSFAVLPSAAGGPTVTKAALLDASGGVSALPGTVVACYRFAQMNFVELVHLADGVLFRVVGTQLVPAVRGYIHFADPAGHFIVVQGTFAGYDASDLPLNDYLEATAKQ